jgi:hypothetical protein
MSAGESLMTSSQAEEAKQELGGIDAQFSRDADVVAVTTAPVVVGLTKEELEHYRNDPKYKALRWILFVLFWLTWVALFAAAILLIVMSPRVDVNKDKVWSATSNTYEIFVPSFRDSDGDAIGDFKGINEKLDNLKNLKVDALLLASVFEYHKDDFGPSEVLSYEKIGERVGGQKQFEELVKAAASEGIKIIVDVPLTVHSQSIYAGKGYVAKTNKFSTLDVTKNASHDILVNCTKFLNDLGVSGVYLHEAKLNDVSVPGFNSLISKIRKEINNKDL